MQIAIVTFSSELMLVVGMFRSESKAARKAMLYPALIRLKIFSNALRAPEKTASLKTEGSHLAEEYPDHLQSLCSHKKGPASRGLFSCFADE